MKIIYGARRTGKTTKLIKECLKVNGLFVTIGGLIPYFEKDYPELNICRPEDIDCKIKEMGVNIIPKLFIDEVPYVLSKLLGKPIEMGTVCRMCDVCGLDIITMDGREICSTKWLAEEEKKNA